MKSTMSTPVVLTDIIYENCEILGIPYLSVVQVYKEYKHAIHKRTRRFGYSSLCQYGGSTRRGFWDEASSRNTRVLHVPFLVQL